MILRKIGLTLAVTGLLASVVPTAAYADGAASTRNIILGGALVGGTLLILNHNKKVHQKEDEMAHAQQAAESEAAGAQSAYAHEASVASSYHSQLQAAYRENISLKRQLASQHSELMKLRQQVGLLNNGKPANSAAFVQPAPLRPAVAAAPMTATSQSAQSARSVPMLSYGWGTL